jgi:hypothetical protein
MIMTAPERPDITLVFPSGSYPLMPYLSMPTLAGYLRSFGYKVRQVDFNLLSFHRLLSRARLEKAADHIRATFRALDRLPSLNEAQADHYHALCSALMAADHTIAHIEEAKASLMREETYSDPILLSDMTRVVLNGLEMISAQHYPTRWDMGDFQMRRHYTWVSDLLDATIDSDENPFVELYRENLHTLLDDQPRVIGISAAFHSQLIPAFTLARLIKEAAPHQFVVMGGTAMSLLAENVEKLAPLFDHIDAIVFNEGEVAALMLLQQLEKGGVLDFVPNLIFKKKDGSIRRTMRGEPPVFSELPTPEFDDLPHQGYFSPVPVIPLLTSRGCYWGKCTFCTHYYTYGDGYRPRLMDRVERDLQEVVRRYGAVRIYFVDESIPIPTARRIAQFLRDNPLPVEWGGDIRFETRLTAQVCRELGEGGCNFLAFGMESANQRVLDMMEKGTRREDIGEALRGCKDADIFTYVMGFFGFPTETQEEAQDTFDFVIDNYDRIGALAFGTFQLNYDSKVAHAPERYGLVNLRPVSESLDFNEVYNYEATSGLQQSEAELMKERLNTAVSQILTKRFPQRLYYFDFFERYLSLVDIHRCLRNPDLRATTPSLTDMINRRASLAQEASFLSLAYSFNEISAHRSISRMRGLTQKSVEREERVFHPSSSPRQLMACPLTSEIEELSPEGFAVLKLLDGTRTIGQAVKEFPLHVRRDLLTLIQNLARRRAVRLEKPGLSDASALATASRFHNGVYNS